MRWTLTCCLAVACGPTEQTAGPAPFEFDERLESRELPADGALRPGVAVDPLTWTPLPGAGCPAFSPLSVQFAWGSRSWVDLERDDRFEVVLANHLASAGVDAERVAAATAAEVERAFSAGAPAITVRSAVDTTLSRTARPTSCPRPFASASDFVATCGAAYAAQEVYLRLGLWLELTRAPDDPAGPVHFVFWGAPAPRAATEAAFREAFAITETRSVRESSDDLPPNNGTRRVSAVSGWPPGTVRSCVSGTVVGAGCVEGLVNSYGLVRWPSFDVAARLTRWRVAERFPREHRVDQAQSRRVRALFERIDTCLERDYPQAIERCLVAFRGQTEDVCEACRVPPACEPRALSESLRDEGAPRRF